MAARDDAEPGAGARNSSTPKEFKLIGKLDLPRKDSHGKTDGTAMFAMDISVDGMVYAVIYRSPRFGGKLSKFDAAEASKVAGYIDAKAMPDGSGRGSLRQEYLGRVPGAQRPQVRVGFQ